jgi:two-component sensor histidine kinase
MPRQSQANWKMDALRQHERLTNDYQERLLQQASEAAAVEERNHLARDLHDSIKQQIFSIRMSAIAAKAHIQPGETKAQEALEDILQSSEEAQVEMQALLQQLRSAPLEHTSLVEAIQTQGRALEYRSGAQVTVEKVDLPAVERCPLSIQEVLFRIAQEAFANIARHARARHVSYIQTQDGEMLSVMISDDGQGFDTQTVRKGMGLTNIQERAQHLDGTLEIESTPGQGTTLHIQIPLLPAPEIQEQQEQKEYITQKIREQAQGGLHLRSTIAALTIVAMLTNMGFFAVNMPLIAENLLVALSGCGLLLMLYGLISAQLAVVRLKRYQGEEDRRFRALSLQLHLGWTSFFRLSLFLSWQFLVWSFFFLPPTPAQWQGKLLLLLVAGSVITLLWLASRQARQAQERYYPLLSRTLLRWEMRLRRQNLRWRLILCLCLGVILLVHNHLFLFVPLTLWQWLQEYLLLSLLVLGLGIVIDTRHLNPWLQLAKTAS